MARRPHDPNVCTPQEVAFVDALLGEAADNATLAAKLAGYSGGKDGRGWKTHGTRLRARPRVVELVKKRRAEIAAIDEEATKRSRNAEIDEIVARRAKLTLGPIANAAQLQALWTAIAFGEVEGASITERLRATELLGRAHGMFVHDNELPPPQPLPSGDGDGPRVTVQILVIDNGRGPAPPAKPLSAGEENKP